MREGHLVDFDAVVDQTNGHATIRVVGEIDQDTAADFRAAVDEALAGSTRVELDLRGTSFMDTSALKVLVDAARRLGQAQEAITIRHARPAILRLFEITGIDALVDLRTDDENDATRLHPSG